MGIRTLCFIGAVLVGDNWLRWVLIAAAFILPYVAVVMANTASPRIEGADLMQPSDGHKALGHKDPGPIDPGPNDPDPNDPGPRDFGQ